MGSFSRRTPVPAAALSAALVAVLGLGLLLAASAPAAPPGIVADRLEPSESGAEVRDYWTPSRMRAATPMPAPLEHGEPSEPPVGSAAEGTGTPLAIAPTDPGAGPLPRLTRTTLAAQAAENPPHGRDEIEDPSAEPFRSHGKVFLTIEGGDFPGDYVCSGTALSSQNRSVVWSAGHCVFDDFGGGFATNWIFVPAYKNGDRPFGTWTAKKLAVPQQWRNESNLKYDLGAAVVRRNGQGERLTELVGGRGIGFDQPRNQTYQSFGYPAQPPPLEFTGGREFRCTSPLVGTDNPGGSGPNTNGIECDMTGGSSGGGWVANGSVLSVNSYSLCIGPACDGHLYGPYQERVARNLYDAVDGSSPRCQGRPVTHIGTRGNDNLVGTSGPDVFKTGKGNDRIRGRGGNDRVCAGRGDDVVKGNRGRDRLKGQGGDDVLRGGKGRRDVCKGGAGRDTARSCERTKRIP